MITEKPKPFAIRRYDDPAPPATEKPRPLESLTRIERYQRTRLVWYADMNELQADRLVASTDPADRDRLWRTMAKIERCIAASVPKPPEAKRHGKLDPRSLTAREALLVIGVAAILVGLVLLGYWLAVEGI